MPDGDGPGVSDDLYALIVYLHASANRDLLDAIGEQQLSYSQLQLLERIRGGRRRPTVKQAAGLIHVSEPAASKIVGQLARRGLVRRETDDRDYRSKRIVITERGEEAIAVLHRARLEEIRAFTAGLNADEHDSLEAALEQLLQREQIRAYRPQPLAA